MTTDPMTDLRDLGSVAALRALAAEGYAPATRPNCNLHIHLPPNFSAFTSVSQAVTMAVDEGIAVLGAGNYYDFTVYETFAAQTREAGIFPMFGTEIIALSQELVEAKVRVNDPGNFGKIYHCGKALTRFVDRTPEARQLIGTIRDADSARMAEVVGKLSALFAAAGIDAEVTPETIKQHIVARCGCELHQVTLQERHLAMGFQQALFDAVAETDRPAALTTLFGKPFDGDATDPVAVQNALRSNLIKAGKPAFVPDTFIDFDGARKLVLELGGIPCYPSLVDAVSPRCEFESTIDQLVANLADLGIHFAEVIPERNTPEALTAFVGNLRAAGIPVTAGTEHNSLSLIPLTVCCKGGDPVPEQVLDWFWEGTCVLAAHQFLCAHGECGYLDATGAPNPAWHDAETRIRDLAALGAAVIRKYNDQHKVK